MTMMGFDLWASWRDGRQPTKSSQPEQSTPVILLPQEVLEEIYVALGDVDDIRNCALVNKAWSLAASSSSSVWRRMAEKRFGSTLAHASLEDYSGSWKKLVTDDNKKGALPSVSMLGKRSNYVRNSVSYFFCCEILDMRWDRHNHKLLVYLNARGERDLRHPSTSCIIVNPVNPGRQDTFRNRRGTIKGLKVVSDSWKGTHSAGHFRGCLSFPATNLLGGGTAKFYFANSRHFGSDYTPVTLWKDQLAMNDLFGGNFLGREAPPPGDDERKRWEGDMVPLAVLERHNHPRALRKWWVE